MIRIPAANKSIRSTGETDVALSETACLLACCPDKRFLCRLAPSILPVLDSLIPGLYVPRRMKTILLGQETRLALRSNSFPSSGMGTHIGKALLCHAGA